MALRFEFRADGLWSVSDHPNGVVGFSADTDGEFQMIVSSKHQAKDGNFIWTEADERPANAMEDPLGVYPIEFEEGIAACEGDREALTELIVCAQTTLMRMLKEYVVRGNVEPAITALGDYGRFAEAMREGWPR